ncbi:unnamed protein product, partial [Mesorhabditis spiculigera]
MLLGCLFCKLPYDEQVGRPHTPCRTYDRNLPLYGAVKCHSCVDDEDSTIAWCLLDLAKAQGLHKQDHDYVFEGHVTLPKCSLCLQDYSKDHFPKALKCGFVMCSLCFAQRNEEERPKCHFCAMNFWEHGDDHLTRVYDRFLNRLYIHNATPLPAVHREEQQHGEENPEHVAEHAENPEHVAEHEENPEPAVQNEENPDANNNEQGNGVVDEQPPAKKDMERTVSMSCETCFVPKTVEDVFKCTECDLRICGTCAFRYHSEHRDSVVAILGLEILKLKDDLLANLHNVFDCYNRDLRQHSGQLIKAISVLIQKTEGVADRLKDQKQMCLAEAIVQRLINMSADFENQCEELTPVLRKVINQIKDLSDSLT